MDAQETKDQTREAVWDHLQSERLARFPFPPHGRIPNFAGAAEAAQRLFEVATWANAKRLKINPDAPQLPVRLEALRRGITVYMPTPRLRAGFLCLDPARIPPKKLRSAASLSGCKEWAFEVPLSELPQMDAIVTGSVAATRAGRRCGKGHGYSDLEYAILRELGHAPCPVATTIHDCQLVEELPFDPLDLPLSVIVTPTQTLTVAQPPAPPAGIDWSRLTEERIAEMPVLAELRARGER